MTSRSLFHSLALLVSTLVFSLPMLAQVSEIAFGTYSNVPFDRATGITGSRFRGADPRPMYSLLHKLDDDEPITHASLPRDASFAFLLNDPTIPVDAYARPTVKMSYEHGNSGISIQLSFAHIKLDDDNRGGVVSAAEIAESTTGGGSYVGQNIYGATVDVSVSHTEMYGIGMPTDSWLSHGATIHIPMESSHAAGLIPYLRVIVIGRFMSPWTRRAFAYGSRPTMSSPYAGGADWNLLMFFPEEVWVYELGHSKVWVKLNAQNLKKGYLVGTDSH